MQWRIDRAVETIVSAKNCLDYVCNIEPGAVKLDREA